MADDNAPDSAPETAAKTDGDPQARAGQSQGQQPGMLPLSITAQYVKDLSFESPNAPAAIVNFTKSKPRIQLNVDVAATQTQDKNFEVTLSLNFEAKHGDVTDFIAELHYCGLCVTGELPENLVQLSVLGDLHQTKICILRARVIEICSENSLRETDVTGAHDLHIIHEPKFPDPIVTADLRFGQIDIGNPTDWAAFTEVAYSD